LTPYHPLNKQGEPSYDPWPDLPFDYFSDPRRHNLTWEAIFSTATQANLRICDFGCGDGRLLERLSKTGFSDLTGVDHSATALERAKVRVPGLKTFQGDLVELGRSSNLPELRNVLQYDVVVCTEVFEHLPNDEDVEIVADLLFYSCAYMGFAVISIPDDSICKIDDDHRRLFQPGDQLKILENAGFVDVHDFPYHYSDEYPQPWLYAIGMMP